MAITTVIANQSADPSTVLVADTIPPSYSSIFCNSGNVMQMREMSVKANTSDASVQVDLIEHDTSKSVRWL